MFLPLDELLRDGVPRLLPAVETKAARETPATAGSDPFQDDEQPAAAAPPIVESPPAAKTAPAAAPAEPPTEAAPVEPAQSPQEAGGGDPFKAL